MNSNTYTQADLSPESKAFQIEENNLITRALTVLIGELATQKDTDSAYDVSTIMQMHLVEMTEKGIKTQPERIAYLTDRLNDITVSNVILTGKAVQA